MTESFSNWRGPSITQSETSLWSKRQLLQMNSSTSWNSSLRPVTRWISFPNIQTVVLPQHPGVVHSLCALYGLLNQTLDLNLKVLSVKAPTGHTSIMFPENSLVIAFEIQVEILAWSPRS